MRSIGLDVHKRFAEVAIIDGSGPPASRRISTTTVALRAFARTLRPDDKVVLEATMNTWAIADVLRESGARLVISNPLRTRAIADARIKTDKVDAATLAQLLAADFVPEVWVPDDATRRLRRELAARAVLVRQRTQVRNRIHAVLQRCLHDPSATDLFGAGGRVWLREVVLPEEERAQVDAALRVHEAVVAEIALIDRRLAKVALADERVERLMTIPGVGPITALGLVGVTATSAASTTRASSSAISAWTRRSASPESAKRGSGTSAAPATRMPAASSSRPHMPRSAHRARSARSSAASRAGVAHRSRSSPSRARLQCSRGTLLTSGERYRFERATVVRDKQRDLERMLGLPVQRRRRGAGVPSLKVLREQELAALAEAEATYRVGITARARRDGAAANGVRL